MAFLGRQRHLEMQSKNKVVTHAHINVWIKHFNELRKLLFHDDETVRDKTIKKFVSYIDKVMTSSYGDDLELLERTCCNNENEKRGSSQQCSIGTPNDLYETISLQTPRDMRHKELCHEHNGYTSQCKICKSKIQQRQIIQQCMRTILKNTRTKDNGSAPSLTFAPTLARTPLPTQRPSDATTTYDSFAPTLTCTPLPTQRPSATTTYDFYENITMKPERLAVLCIRHPYDVLEYLTSNEPAIHAHYSSIASLNRMLVAVKFNEHDYLHRPTCFKKGNECRSQYPRIDNMETELEFDDVKKRHYVAFH